MSQLVAHLLAGQWHNLHGSLSRVQDGRHPGVYLLAYSDRDLTGQSIDLQDVFYVGMSNSRGGVRQRLRQFLHAIEKGSGHSGGNRFFTDYARRTPFSRPGREAFFVASISVPCIPEKDRRTPADLRKMGDVAALEYYVLAHIKQALGQEPELNKK